jgi:hypothetical protein
MILPQTKDFGPASFAAFSLEISAVLLHADKSLHRRSCVLPPFSLYLCSLMTVVLRSLG